MESDNNNNNKKHLAVTHPSTQTHPFIQDVCDTNSENVFVGLTDLQIKVKAKE